MRRWVAMEMAPPGVSGDGGRRRSEGGGGGRRRWLWEDGDGVLALLPLRALGRSFRRRTRQRIRGEEAARDSERRLLVAGGRGHVNTGQVGVVKSRRNRKEFLGSLARQLLVSRQGRHGQGPYEDELRIWRSSGMEGCLGDDDSSKFAGDASVAEDLKLGGSGGNLITVVLSSLKTMCNSLEVGAPMLMVGMKLLVGGGDVLKCSFNWIKISEL